MRNLILAIGLFLAVSTSFSQSVLKDYTFVSLSQQYWSIDDSTMIYTDTTKSVNVSCRDFGFVYELYLFCGTDDSFVVYAKPESTEYTEDGIDYVEYAGIDGDKIDVRILCSMADGRVSSIMVTCPIYEIVFSKIY